MGHLDQEHQGLQSTKSKALNHILKDEIHSDFKADFFPTSYNPKKTHDCVATLVPFQTSKKGYMDLTGHFPHKSSSGNEYLLVVYDYDSNAILAEALSSCQGGEIKRG